MSLEELLARRKALAESPGAALASDLQALTRSRRLFGKNCDELLELLNPLADPASALQLLSVENREGFNRFLDEVDRLLHNAVAAAHSLREHSFRVRDKWLPVDPGDELGVEYHERARVTFAESTTAQLVAGLRIIVQHRKLPRLLGHTAATMGESFTSGIVLDAEDLLRWDRWRPEIREMLEEREERIALDELVTEYRAAVEAFHTWFVAALAERNAALLDELERSRRELVEYERTLFGPPVDPPEQEYRPGGS